MTLLRKFTLTLVVVLQVLGSSSYASAAAAPLYNETGGLISQISRLAGSGMFGEQEGTASSASFRQTAGLAVGANDELYISDALNHKIQKLSSGRLSVYAGPSSSILRDAGGQPLGALLDGSREHSLFQAPVGLAFGADGSLYVADSANNAIRKIASSGEVTTLSGNGKIGSADGKGAAATFYHPEGIAVAPNGEVYVADTLNHLIRKISPDGTTVTLNTASERVVERYPGLALPAGDFKDGALEQALFNEPTGLALDAKGNLYVSDSGNQRIRYIDFSLNRVSTLAGGDAAVYASNALYATEGYKNGAANKAAFHFPKGIALDAAGGLLIADSGNHVIRYLKNGAVSTVAGSPAGEAGFQDGIESSALFDSPLDVAVASNGTIYVADSGNSMIRAIVPYRLPAGISANQAGITVMVGTQQIQFDAKPEISKNRVMVPVRQIAEGLSYTLTFSKDGQTVTLEKKGQAIELYLGSTTIKRKAQSGAGTIGKTDAAPYVKNNRIFVPLRFFAEEAGMDVQWVKSYQTAILRSK
ncbi:SMP-30/gluconolactonase/LRE family protein [Paenibacillus sonchi]|uniref:SMP-30/gluconolactonase/LRE family protein n=1 Tax=Paenibacillus sonchi TaxID=373687 RepID=A0A974PHJ8_9BACL|nr:stalk domain-containing protein [Paenibacillus sonchi]QQZ63653.1 SMP-30/gluconolactonase/LRE family protein [Paenibacillus sonchi]